MKALRHTHTHTLTDRRKWYSYNWSYIVNKSLQHLMNIHSVMWANFHYLLAAEGEKATQTLCFLVACVAMSEINRTTPAGNDSFDFWRRLKVRRDLACDYSWCHAAAGSFLSFGLVTQRCRVDDQSNYVWRNFLHSQMRSPTYFWLAMRLQRANGDTGTVSQNFFFSPEKNTKLKKIETRVILHKMKVKQLKINLSNYINKIK